MKGSIDLEFQLQAQPTETSCGPTCLQAVYHHYGDQLPLERLIAEIPELATGGTLAVQLGIHALERGYSAELYTYNLRVFDPTWFDLSAEEMRGRLQLRSERRHSDKRRRAMKSYLRFLELGGQARLEVMNPALIRRLIESEAPILTGLSATFLYSAKREIPESDRPDDVRGEPVGHFVVLCGYLGDSNHVLVADPYRDNPLSQRRIYPVGMDRLITAILLGVLTYDGNLLVIRPQ